ncbi:hypothetical protein BCR32DRAFT_325071 [Anaeromyces robustus]|uniref:Uncharacterized protein n=1 Tax=Anaeromyces robustus TaxID=1754192 RepID=A0A1Y1XKG1_9FUNG|nr:hypothetical protein BCR32DRAFT_325071 [Anaeromyces robustus]|eukprot:ORX86183.1 hypothetical protein BCR32DRAFT_325071 [Anaeromyces robustus]
MTKGYLKLINNVIDVGGNEPLLQENEEEEGENDFYINNNKSPFGMVTKALNNEICVLNNRYISNTKTIFYLNCLINARNQQYIITDENKNNLFLCNIYNSKKCKLFDINNAELLQFHIKTTLDGLRLYVDNCNMYEDNLKIKFLQRKSMKAIKYTIEYFNQYTGREEILDVNCTSNYFNIGIYYGKRKEGGSLICSINRPQVLSKNLIIEIAPDVDIMFMITIIFGIIELLLEFI